MSALLNLLAGITGSVPPQTSSVDELAVTGKRNPPGLMRSDLAPMQAPDGPIQGPVQGPQMDPKADPVAPPQAVAQTPAPPGLNYNNRPSVDALSATMSGMPTPQGGSANPGVYGLLPQHLQHGTLRNVLGALGDAFLVGSNRQAVYRPRMEQQAIGQAMAGMDINDPASVAAAVQRVAATGSPGSVEMADKLQQQAEQAALRRQYMEYNQQYRQGMLEDRANRTEAQRAMVADRYRPQIGGMLAGVKDAATYATKYNSLTNLAHQLGGPDATPASLWSIPEPGNWTPELTSNYGMTANNVQQSADRAAGRETSERNTDVRANATLGAAGMGASSRIGAASISANRPSDALRRQQLGPKIDAGTATAAEQQEWAHLTQTGRGSGRRSLPPSVAGGNIADRVHPGGPVVTNGDVNYLRANDTPANRARFESHFGPGTAKKYLGH